MRIYELRVEVVGEPVWRRIEVPGQMTLAALHLTLQRALGWANAGLYAFETHEQRYGVLNHEDTWMRDPRRTDVSVRRVAELAERTTHIEYVYEGVSTWRHVITVEGLTSPLDGERYPRITGGEGDVASDAFEPGLVGERAVELPGYDALEQQAGADAGFDALARLMGPPGEPPLLERGSSMERLEPLPRRAPGAPPHVIRPAELMVACTARLGDEHPGDLDAFVLEVAREDLAGVHDMYTRKVVSDWLRDQLGPPPELEPLEELEPDSVEEPVSEPVAQDDSDALDESVHEDAVVGDEVEPSDERAEPAVEAQAPALEEGDGSVEDLERGDVLDVDGDDLDEDEGEEDEPHGVDAPLEAPSETPLEPVAPLEGDSAGLGELEDLELPSSELGVVEEIDPDAPMEQLSELSAWEEESWDVSELEPGEDAPSLGDVSEFEASGVGQGELELPELGELTSSGLSESAPALEGLGAFGFEAPRALDASSALDAWDDFGDVEVVGFEQAPPAPEERFEAVRDEGDPVEYERDEGLKALPRSGALGACLDRVPVEWLDAIAERLEIEEARRAERAERVADWLGRIDRLEELVRADLDDDARALLAWLASREAPASADELAQAGLAPAAPDAFTFESSSPLGVLRRRGLAYVGVSGASAVLQVRVPVELGRALQIMLRPR